MDASSVKYAGCADKKHMLDQLCSSIARLSSEQCIQVLEASTASPPLLAACIVSADAQAAHLLLYIAVVCVYLRVVGLHILG